MASRRRFARTRAAGRAIGRAIAAGIRITRARRLQRMRDGELRGSVPRGHGRVRARGRAYKAAVRRRR